MVDNVRYVISSVLDAGTCSSSSSTAGLPATNVKNTLIRQEWRSLGKANEWLRFRASGGATSINCVFIGNHSFSKNAVLLWQGNTTSNFASGPALSTSLSVVTDARGAVVPKITHFYANVQSFAHWRLYIRDSGNASSTLSIGRIVAGRYTQPTRNIRDGFQMKFLDPSRGRVTAGRQGYFNVRKTYQEFEFGHTDIGEDQLDVMRGIFNAVGKNAAFVFSLDPDSRPSHNTIYTMFQSDLSAGQRVLRQYGVNSITLSEKN